MVCSPRIIAANSLHYYGKRFKELSYLLAHLLNEIAKSLSHREGTG
jgi:hypothetical protein